MVWKNTDLYVANSNQGRGLVCGLTEKGKAYLSDNPKLKNPFTWDIILRYATIIAAVSATLALFVGCIRLRFR